MKQIIIDNQPTNYSISRTGECYNNKTNRFLKGQISNSGYLNFQLSLSEGKRRLYAHRLVAEFFVDNPDNKKEVNHIDGNKMNNDMFNLEWCSPKENIRHAVNEGLIKTKPIYCFNKNKEIIAEYKSLTDLVDQLGHTRSVIRQEVLAEVKTLSYGCYWSYEKTIKKTQTPICQIGVSKPVYQYNLENVLVGEYESTKAAGLAVGASQGSHIGECCRGKIKTYKGFIWRYKEDIV